MISLILMSRCSHNLHNTQLTIMCTIYCRIPSCTLLTWSWSIMWSQYLHYQHNTLFSGILEPQLYKNKIIQKLFVEFFYKSILAKLTLIILVDSTWIHCFSGSVSRLDGHHCIWAGSLIFMRDLWWNAQPRSFHRPTLDLGGWSVLGVNMWIIWSHEY